jgi:transcriptional regulator with XRE-family HTH domain
MTQGELSNKSGVGLAQISKLERNKADPAASTLVKLMDALECSADRLLIDKTRSGMRGLLKEQFERVSGLPQEDQNTIIKIMDKFCIANGLKTMLDEHRVLIGISGSSGVKPVLEE